MKHSLATVDEDFAQIDNLLRELRKRIEHAAEVVRIAAARAARVKKAVKPRTWVKPRKPAIPARA